MRLLDPSKNSLYTEIYMSDLYRIAYCNSKEGAYIKRSWLIKGLGESLKNALFKYFESSDSEWELIEDTVVELFFFENKSIRHLSEIKIQNTSLLMDTLDHLKKELDSIAKLNREYIGRLLSSVFIENDLEELIAIGTPSIHSKFLSDETVVNCGQTWSATKNMHPNLFIEEFSSVDTEAVRFHLFNEFFNLLLSRLSAERYEARSPNELLLCFEKNIAILSSIFPDFSSDRSTYLNSESLQSIEFEQLRNQIGKNLNLYANNTQKLFDPLDRLGQEYIIGRHLQVYAALRGEVFLGSHKIIAVDGISGVGKTKLINRVLEDWSSPENLVIDLSLSSNNFLQHQEIKSRIVFELLKVALSLIKEEAISKVEFENYFFRQRIQILNLLVNTENDLWKDESRAFKETRLLESEYKSLCDKLLEFLIVEQIAIFLKIDSEFRIDMSLAKESLDFMTNVIRSPNVRVLCSLNEMTDEFDLAFKLIQQEQLPIKRIELLAFSKEELWEYISILALGREDTKEALGEELFHLSMGKLDRLRELVLYCQKRGVLKINKSRDPLWDLSALDELDFFEKAESLGQFLFKDLSDQEKWIVKRLAICNGAIPLETIYMGLEDRSLYFMQHLESLGFVVKAERFNPNIVSYKIKSPSLRKQILLNMTREERCLYGLQIARDLCDEQTHKTFKSIEVDLWAKNLDQIRSHTDFKRSFGSFFEAARKAFALGNIKDSENYVEMASVLKEKFDFPDEAASQAFLKLRIKIKLKLGKIDLGISLVEDLIAKTEDLSERIHLRNEFINTLSLSGKHTLAINFANANFVDLDFSFDQAVGTWKKVGSIVEAYFSRFFTWKRKKSLKKETLRESLILDTIVEIAFSIFYSRPDRFVELGIASISLSKVTGERRHLPVRYLSYAMLLYAYLGRFDLSKLYINMADAAAHLYMSEEKKIRVKAVKAILMDSLNMSSKQVYERFKTLSENCYKIGDEVIFTQLESIRIMNGMVSGVRAYSGLLEEIREKQFEIHKTTLENLRFKLSRFKQVAQQFLKMNSEEGLFESSRKASLLKSESEKESDSYIVNFFEGFDHCLKGDYKAAYANLVLCHSDLALKVTGPCHLLCTLMTVLSVNKLRRESKNLKQSFVWFKSELYYRRKYRRISKIDKKRSAAFSLFLTGTLRGVNRPHYRIQKFEKALNLAQEQKENFLIILVSLSLIKALTESNQEHRAGKVLDDLMLLAEKSGFARLTDLLIRKYSESDWVPIEDKPGIASGFKLNLSDQFNRLLTRVSRSKGNAFEDWLQGSSEILKCKRAILLSKGGATAWRIEALYDNGIVKKASFLKVLEDQMFNAEAVEYAVSLDRDVNIEDINQDEYFADKIYFSNFNVKNLLVLPILNHLDESLLLYIEDAGVEEIKAMRDEQVCVQFKDLSYLLWKSTK